MFYLTTSHLGIPFAKFLNTNDFNHLVLVQGNAEPLLENKNIKASEIIHLSELETQVAHQHQYAEYMICTTPENHTYFWDLAIKWGLPYLGIFENEEVKISDSTPYFYTIISYQSNTNNTDVFALALAQMFERKISGTHNLS